MRVLGIVTSLASVLIGCGQGQVGSDYRGEPLMLVQGEVKSSDVALSTDLVPGLAFTSKYDVGRPDWTVYYVPGEVEGTFPSSFTMRVYDAPDEQVLDDLIQGEPAFNFNGFITAMPADHPRWLRRDQVSETQPDGSTLETARLCADSGMCLTGGKCAPDDDTWPCGHRFPDDLPWATYGRVQGYVVLYVAGPVAADSVLASNFAQGHALEAGYHVLKLVNLQDVLSAADFAANNDCLTAAWTQAIEQVNTEYGTNYDPQDNSLAVQRDPKHFRAWDAYTMRNDAAMGCRSPYEPVDTESNPLELSFVDQPIAQF